MNIGQVLRHKQLESTAIYAKVDLQALETVRASVCEVAVTCW
jgi:hypothetical protein